MDDYDAWLRAKDVEENPNNPFHDLNKAVGRTVASMYEDVDGETLAKNLMERERHNSN